MTVIRADLYGVPKPSHLPADVLVLFQPTTGETKMSEYIDYTNQELADEVMRVISSESREIGKRTLRELLEEIKNRALVKTETDVTTTAV